MACDPVGRGNQTKNDRRQGVSPTGFATQGINLTLLVADLQYAHHSAFSPR